jgi:hypothetical protein
MPESLDRDDTVCAFGKRCSTSMSRHGGFDRHHEFPMSLGGTEDQTTMLTLCPNHHRRQHALIRYLYETRAVYPGPEDGHDYNEVMRHFTKVERDAAFMAFNNWIRAGQPPIEGWTCPAARP